MRPPRMKHTIELEHHLHNCADPHNQYNFDFGHYITVVKNIFWHLSIIEMSSSWNFPARASPSYEGSEPSRAELGHFNFRAQTELKFF